ncbi:MAG TPA: hypothetical protein VGQ05_00960 [Streptosporangiaceae bacterium]|nr:hypothetical protein [Streptosporangiaceae bacterium]
MTVSDAAGLPDFEYPVIHPFDVERGAVCEDCDQPFRLGDRYASRLLSIAGGIPVTEAVCLSCESRQQGGLSDG